MREQVPSEGAPRLCLKLPSVQRRWREKEMVPSDPISSLAHRGHATALSIASRSAVRFAGPLHGCRISQLPLQSIPARRSLSVTEPFARNGFSLARDGFRFHGFHSGVNGPSLLLRSLAARSTRPFDFRLRRPNRLAPTPAVSQPQARCASPGQLIRLLSPSPLPSRSFRSFGIKAFNGLRRRPVRLSNLPDLRSLPDARSIASFGAGSTSAVRYVFEDLLFLKPLGTILNMRP